MITMNDVRAVIEKGPYKDDWNSLAKHPLPEWFRDGKFGIFIHWGVYSVPAFGSEWYPRNMYIQGSPEFEHHIKTYGPHKDFGYKDFIPMFKAEKFDAAEWASLFKESGAKYIVPVAEHHDGFQMYKSELSHWNAAEMGPKRDVLGELEEAFDQEGLVRGASSHRVEHWFFLCHGREFESDFPDPIPRDHLYWPAMPEQGHQDIYSKPGASDEFMEDWLLRTCELIDNYRPKILYFDWWIQHESVKKWLKMFAAYYYNRALEWGEDVLINYKHDAFAFGAGVLDTERGHFAEVKPYYWQTDTSVAMNSWGYTENNHYRSSAALLADLVDIVSKNGNLLLNVGPKADGTIPDEDAKILREMGAWLKKNGEAIYGSHVWRKFGEGPTVIEEGEFSEVEKSPYTSADIRYTCRDGYLYAIVLKPAADGKYTIPTLGYFGEGDSKGNLHAAISKVEMPGETAPLLFTRDRAGLHIQAPIPAEGDENPVVFRVTME